MCRNTDTYGRFKTVVATQAHRSDPNAASQAQLHPHTAIYLAHTSRRSSKARQAEMRLQAATDTCGGHVHARAAIHNPLSPETHARDSAIYPLQPPMEVRTSGLRDNDRTQHMPRRESAHHCRSATASGTPTPLPLLKSITNIHLHHFKRSMLSCRLQRPR